jgi:hypothetical protein
MNRIASRIEQRALHLGREWLGLPALRGAIRSDVLFLVKLWLLIFMTMGALLALHYLGWI